MVHSTARFARIKKVLCVPDPNMCILKSKKEAKKVEAEARKDDEEDGEEAEDDDEEEEVGRRSRLRWRTLEGATEAVDDVITKTSAPASVAACNAAKVPLMAGWISASGSSVAPMGSTYWSTCQSKA